MLIMAKGDIYNNSTNIRGNNTQHVIQPSGSSVLCLSDFRQSIGDANMSCGNNTGYSSGTGDNAHTMRYTLGVNSGTDEGQPHTPSLNGKLTLNSSHYIRLKGFSSSSSYFAYWLSGIYLA